MFGLNSPVLDREGLREAVKRACRSPDHIWIPLSPTPLTVKEPQNLKHWNKLFPKTDDEIILPERKPLEELVDSYIQMGYWDFGFLLVALVYYGRLLIPSMDAFLWHGVPGASRLWLMRGRVMIPIPNGPVKTILETWWALSGGYLNPTRKMLPIDIAAFEQHFRSIDSPIILVKPWETDDPDIVLSKIQSMHANELAYPMAPGYSAISTIRSLMEEEPVKKWHAYWYKDTPIETEKLYPAPRQDKEACEEGPLGIEWLNAARDTIPDRIYKKALSLRMNGYAHV